MAGPGCSVLLVLVQVLVLGCVVGRRRRMSQRAQHPAPSKGTRHSTVAFRWSGQPCSLPAACRSRARGNCAALPVFNTNLTNHGIPARRERRRPGPRHRLHDGRPCHRRPPIRSTPADRHRIVSAGFRRQRRTDANLSRRRQRQRFRRLRSCAPAAWFGFVGPSRSPPGTWRQIGRRSAPKYAGDSPWSPQKYVLNAAGRCG